MLKKKKDFPKKTSKRIFFAILGAMLNVEKQGKKIRNRGSGTSPAVNEIHFSEYMEIPPPSHRKRSRTKSKIELSEKITIVHQVLNQHIPIVSVAKEHRVS